MCRGLVTQLVTRLYIRGHAREPDIGYELVGVAGFEPAASSSRTKRAAKLRYTPPARNLTGAARDFDSLAEARGCSRIAGQSASQTRERVVRDWVDVPSGRLERVG